LEQGASKSVQERGIYAASTWNFEEAVGFHAALDCSHSEAAQMPRSCTFFAAP
jgi:hypothetical protein